MLRSEHMAASGREEEAGRDVTTNAQYSHRCERNRTDPNRSEQAEPAKKPEGD